MKVGDRVTKPKVWRVEHPQGTVKKVAMEYIVISWEGIPGDWHYKNEQTTDIEVINDESG